MNDYTQYISSTFLNGNKRISHIYKCDECIYETPYPSKLKRHFNSYEHKRNTLTLEYETLTCPSENCKYKTINKRAFRDHRNKCLKKYLVFEEDFKNVVKNNDFIYEKDIIEKEISLLLYKFKINKIDPNKHFNYLYYASNIDKLTIGELNDFFKELKYISC